MGGGNDGDVPILVECLEHILTFMALHFFCNPVPRVPGTRAGLARDRLLVRMRMRARVARARIGARAPNLQRVFYALA